MLLRHWLIVPLQNQRTLSQVHEAYVGLWKGGYGDALEEPEGIYDDHWRGSLYQSQLHDYNLDVARLAVASSLLDALEAILRFLTTAY